MLLITASSIDDKPFRGVTREICHRVNTKFKLKNIGYLFAGIVLK